MKRERQEKPFDINSIQLDIQSPHMEISKPLTEYIFTKIEKLGKTYRRIRKCKVLLKELKSDKNKNFEVSAEIFVPGHVLFAAVKNENPRLSVKTAFDDLHKQLVRFKEKVTEKK